MNAKHSAKTVEQAVRCPAEAYAAPADILGDDRLSFEQKEKALDNWAEAERQMLVADAENMPRTDGGDDAPGALLQDIRAAKAALVAQVRGR